MGSQVKLTDAEKTRRLAEGCMGWKYSPETEITWSYWDGPRGFMHLTLHWQPLHNESHAAEVREAMRAKGWEVLLTYAKRQDISSMSNKAVDIIRGGEHGAMMRLSVECALLALGLAKEEEL